MLLELLRQSFDASLMVQIALAVGTWALVYISAYFMNKSANHIGESNKLIRDANETSKVELRARLRPEIEFLGVTCSLKSDGQAMQVRGVMENTGTVPALNVRSAFAETAHRHLREIVNQSVNQAIFTKGLSYGSLSPGSDTDLLFSMDWNPINKWAF